MLDHSFVFRTDLHDTPGLLGIDGREKLHDLDQAQGIARRDLVADFDDGFA